MSVFKVSDTDESVLDLNEIVEGRIKERQRASVQDATGRNHPRHEKQPGDDIQEILCYRQLQQSVQLESLLSLYIQDTVQKSECRDCITLIKMAVRYLKQKFREKHFFSRERQFEKTACSSHR